MNSIWRFEQVAIVVLACLMFAYATFFLGSALGELLESFIRGIPGFFYHLPQNVLSALSWLWALLLAILLNPLHAICISTGVVLVVVYLMGTAGFFEIQTPVHRGSRIRNGRDIRERLELEDEIAPRKKQWLPRVFRGAQLTTYDDLELRNNPRKSLWSSIKWKIKSIFHRP